MREIYRDSLILIIELWSEDLFYKKWHYEDQREFLVVHGSYVFMNDTVCQAAGQQSGPKGDSLVSCPLNLGSY